MPEDHAGHHHPHSHAETTPVLRLAGNGRSLTPADVRNKVFATVRVREGYDMSQVDEFLDQVEATLNQVLRENAELRSRPVEESAPQIIALAQEAAERAVAMADEQAKAIVAEARVRAKEVQRAALTYGDQVRDGLQDQIRQLRSLLAELEKRTVALASPSDGYSGHAP
jgi:DivIVA domain-containing protein